MQKPSATRSRAIVVEKLRLSPTFWRRADPWSHDAPSRSQQVQGPITRHTSAGRKFDITDC
jgi:hypothetical protein